MLKRNLYLWIALSCLLSAVLTGSLVAVSFQPPSQQPAAEAPQAEATGEQIKESFWSNPLNDPVALFTAVLTAFTGGLFWSTVKLWGATRQSVDIAKDAADAAAMAANAAKKSADVAVAAERAYLFVDHIAVDIDWPTLASETRTSQLDIIFQNHGKTPAILREIYWSVVFHPYLPNVDDAKKAAGGPFPMSAIVQAGSVSETYGGGFEIPGRLVDDIQTGVELMCFAGRIVYDDIFGQPHETHFCRQYWTRTRNFDVAVSDYLNRYT